MNEYIAARQQLQEQAQQIEASEKLRMQQVRTVVVFVVRKRKAANRNRGPCAAIAECG